MIGQTLAIFVDAYRELNSKKLFWIVMLLSGLVVIAFSMITLTPTGIKLIFWPLDNDFMNSTVVPPRVFYYNLLFVGLGVKWWLGLAATVLALISTASIFPDMVSSGSIEAMLARPISRTRLFLTQYVAGLLFVVLQVAVFCVASFLLIGIKASLWDFSILLGVPIIALFYSYLFCVCALLGLWTRSTIAALLLTVLFWLMMFGMQTTENVFLSLRVNREVGIQHLHDVVPALDRQVEALEKLQDRADSLSVNEARAQVSKIVGWSFGDDRHKGIGASRAAAEVPPGVTTGAELVAARLEERRQARSTLDLYIEHAESRGQWIVKWHGILHGVATVLPKTGETKDLLNRYLVPSEDIEAMSENDDRSAESPFGGPSRPPDAPALPLDVQEAIKVSSADFAEAMQASMLDRSVWWIVGTSLGFECAVLMLASLYFARRDF